MGEDLLLVDMCSQTGKGQPKEDAIVIFVRCNWLHHDSKLLYTLQSNPRSISYQSNHSHFTTLSQQHFDIILRL